MNNPLATVLLHVLLVLAAAESFDLVYVASLHYGRPYLTIKAVQDALPTARVDPVLAPLVQMAYQDPNAGNSSSVCSRIELLAKRCPTCTYLLNTPSNTLTFPLEQYRMKMSDYHYIQLWDLERCLNAIPAAQMTILPDLDPAIIRHKAMTTNASEDTTEWTNYPRALGAAIDIMLVQLQGLTSSRVLPFHLDSPQATAAIAQCVVNDECEQDHSDVYAAVRRDWEQAVLGVRPGLKYWMASLEMSFKLYLHVAAAKVQRQLLAGHTESSGIGEGMVYDVMKSSLPQDLIRASVQHVDALSQLAPGTLRVAKHTYQETRVNFFAGPEGSGHHFWSQGIFPECPKNTCAYDGSVSVQWAHFWTCFKEHTSLPASRHISAGRKLEAAYNKTLSKPVLFINGAGRSAGQMSYPNFAGPFKLLKYPDAVQAAQMLERAGKDFRMVLMLRSPFSMLTSTTNRGFGSIRRQLQSMYMSLSVLYVQVMSTDTRFWACWDFEADMSQQCKALSDHLGLSKYTSGTWLCNTMNKAASHLSNSRAAVHEAIAKLPVKQLDLFTPVLNLYFALVKQCSMLKQQ